MISISTVEDDVEFALSIRFGISHLFPIDDSYIKVWDEMTDLVICRGVGELLALEEILLRVLDQYEQKSRVPEIPVPANQSSGGSEYQPDDDRPVVAKVMLRLSVLRRVAEIKAVHGWAKRWEELSDDDLAQIQPKNRFEEYLDVAAKIVKEEHEFNTLQTFWEAVAEGSPEKTTGGKVTWQRIRQSFVEKGVFEPNMTLTELYLRINPEGRNYNCRRFCA